MMTIGKACKYIYKGIINNDLFKTFLFLYSIATLLRKPYNPCAHGTSSMRILFGHITAL